MISINNVILSTLVLSLAVTSIGCLSLGNSRIYYGHEAAVGQFPYQVAIHKEIRAEFLYSCSGTILSEQFILTAANCITEASEAFPERFQVFVGALNRTDGQMYEVKKLYVHENFTEERGPYGGTTGMHNDIALIELKTPIEFSENVSLIPLNRQFIPENVQTVLSGYGDEWAKHTGELNYGGMTTLSVAECNAVPVRSKSTLCAFSVDGGGACRGDGGSPLTFKRTLVGILSWAPVGCYLDEPDGFTRVSLFIEWIEETMRNAIEN